MKNKIISIVMLFFIISTILPSKIVSSLEDVSKVQVIKELVEERKENKKVFLNSDGTYTVRLYNEPIHYL